MSNIKLITKDTDLSKVLIPVNWDVVLYGEPYQVYRAEEYNQETGETILYIHSIGGKWGDNNYWTCPRNEEPSYENLEMFCGDACCWGVNVISKNTHKSKFECVRVNHSYLVEITRNGEVFNSIRCNDMAYGIARAQVLIAEYSEHPLELNNYDWNKNLIGRHVKYNGIPAVISHYCDGQACIFVKPLNYEDIYRFYDKPWYGSDDYSEYYEECRENEGIKVEITSPHIWWFE